MEQFNFSPYSSSMEQTPSNEVVNSPMEAQSKAASPINPVAVPVSAEPPKKQKNGVWMTIAIIAVCFSLLMGCFAIWAATGSQQVFQIPQSVTPSYNFNEDVTEDDALTPQQIIQKLTPSVVTVLVQGYNEQGQLATGFGTGIIYTDNGYILTNAHVVENTVSVTVRDYQGVEYSAFVIGSDSDSDTAVIKIDATGLTPAEFGESSKVVPGDSVIAIGTPYAEELSYTATSGIVSARRDNMNFPELGYTLDLIQHDAAINSGNSGGPLVNIYGQVIGINSIKIAGTYENLGFALQIDQVLPLAEEIMNTGKVSRPAIGITGSTYQSEDLKGVYVRSVTPGGPAATAGLRQGDIIIKLNQTDISDINHLKDLLDELNVGDSVTVTYLRQDTVYTAELVLADLS